MVQLVDLAAVSSVGDLGVKVCPKCKGQHDEPTKTCAACLAAHAEYKRQYRDKMRQQGRCTECGKPSESYRCPACSKTATPDRVNTGRRRREAIMDTLRAAHAQIEYALYLAGNRPSGREVEIGPEIRKLRDKFEATANKILLREIGEDGADIEADIKDLRDTFEAVADMIVMQQLNADTAGDRRWREKYKRRLGAQG